MVRLCKYDVKCGHGVLGSCQRRSTKQARQFVPRLPLRLVGWGLGSNVSSGSTRYKGQVEIEFGHCRGLEFEDWHLLIGSTLGPLRFRQDITKTRTTQASIYTCVCLEHPSAPSSNNTILIERFAIECSNQRIAETAAPGVRAATLLCILGYHLVSLCNESNRPRYEDRERDQSSCARVLDFRVLFSGEILVSCAT